jgi:hypothetical protein
VASWDQRLARPINLKGSGKKLLTLRDAGDFLRANFQTVRRNAMLDGALEDLIAAAESGQAADRRRATDQLETLLHHALLIEGARPRSKPGKTPDLERRIRAMLTGERSKKRSGSRA